jgi:hypothetical protein
VSGDGGNGERNSEGNEEETARGARRKTAREAMAMSSPFATTESTVPIVKIIFVGD